jgi:formate hydrogenlyase subunit 3/multisubunit Na+/H+ antiporter MnhD subunit
VRKEKVPDYAGLYERNQFLVLGLSVAALSLGGMPGFNIFVGEYLIYGALFTVHPALTLLAVFASLVAFIFYFRICYVMFAGTRGKEIRLGLISKAVLAALSLAVIGLGVIPEILLRVLEWFV